MCINIIKPGAQNVPLACKVKGQGHDANEMPLNHDTPEILA